MNIKLLKKILAVASPSLREEQMVAFVTDYVKERRGRRCVRCWSDRYNNVYIVKGHAEHYPCVAAHLDTVHQVQPHLIVEQDGIIFGLDAHDKRTGIGADDKCGVYVCLELLERIQNLAVALFAGEEVGCQGAFAADARFFDQVGYVIEFDCPAFALCSYTSGGVWLFQESGDFIQTARPVLNRHGFNQWQRHPFSDVMALRKRFSLPCLNVSSGYYNWHASDECLKLADLGHALELALELIPALGERRYDDAAALRDADVSPPGGMRAQTQLAFRFEACLTGTMPQRGGVSGICP